MRLSQIDPRDLTQPMLAQLLFGPGEYADLGQPGDAIFVFGAVRKGGPRVLKATELFKAGRAPYILFTGGNRYGRRSVPEAILMRDKAIEEGVPPESILVETDSNHTTENVIASQLVLDRTIGLHKIRRLLVVSSGFHMRRALLNLQTYMPGWIELVWCPATAPGNWWEDPDMERLVHKELKTLLENVREGRVMDAEIAAHGRPSFSD